MNNDQPDSEHEQVSDRLAQRRRAEEQGERSWGMAAVVVFLGSILIPLFIYLIVLGPPPPLSPTGERTAEVAAAHAFGHGLGQFFARSIAIYCLVVGIPVGLGVYWKGRSLLAAFVASFLLPVILLGIIGSIAVAILT